MNTKLNIKKYNQEGDIAHEYNPLFNKLENNIVTDFITKQFTINLNHNINIECQPSYDGTVNLIINDDINPPRIINTRFTVTENNRYRTIIRNQREQTNLYKSDEIDRQTRLFRNINLIPKLQLVEVNYFGQLKCGNYTFYVKYADNDYNQTDVVCESGQVSVFHGTINNPTTIHGGLVDELTDKSVLLKLSNIDTSFSRAYLYFTRETSDLNGIRMTYCGMVKTPYEIKNKSLIISLNGFEEVTELNIEDLNIQYNLTTAVKTQAQVQNMLFFGNIQGLKVDITELQNISYYIQASCKQTEQSIGYLDHRYLQQSQDDLSQSEYYNPSNIYYRLGYWPDEIYRFGIVYIFNDDSLSPVFNLRGCKFNNLNDMNYIDDGSEYTQFKIFNPEINKDEIQYVPKDDFISGKPFLTNTKGVFRMPKGQIVDDIAKTSKPFYMHFEINPILLKELKTVHNVKGYFFVRQKRIPITLCQGLSIGVDKISYVPMLAINQSPVIINKKGDYTYPSTDNNLLGTTIFGSASLTVGGKYVTESFTNRFGDINGNFDSRLIYADEKQSSGLLSLDPSIDWELKSNLDGTKYTIVKNKSGILTKYLQRNWFWSNNNNNNNNVTTQTECIFIDENIPLKYINKMGFSTRSGSAETVKGMSYFKDKDCGMYRKNSGSISSLIWALLRNSFYNNYIVRGIYAPFIGTTANLEDNCIYDIKIQNYSSVFEQEYFKIRMNSNVEFYAISDREQILTSDFEPKNPLTKPVVPNKIFNIYRGDCYSCTVSIRMNRNFVENGLPTSDLIVNAKTWSENYKGLYETTADDWSKMNRADINACKLGHWVTFKCLSNNNLGLRAKDRSIPDEQAIMGNPRSFYPVNDMNINASGKISDSYVLNNGYSNTVSKKRFFTSPDVPYIKDMFDNRIMFSNVQQDDQFRNAYRIFQGLSYKDIDRQYGAIVKLLPYGVNLFCVFEHGLAVIPINEKALMATNTGQSIHMYGAEVIQNQLSLISPDYGSIWQESIVRTPVGIYGVDSYAKKIWRFTDAKGLELLSDTKIQRFLNDRLKLNEKDKYPTIGLKNVKTHYNNYKGDVIFTFYNDWEDEEWSFCYNERQDKWITRYSWIPLYSENINNIFYSLDKKRAEVLAYIYDNTTSEVGIHTSNNEWIYTGDKYPNGVYNNMTIDLTLKGYDFYNDCDIAIENIQSSYLNDLDEEIEVILPNKDLPETDEVEKTYITLSKTYIDINPDEANPDVNYDEAGNILLPDNTTYNYRLSKTTMNLSTDILNFIDDNGVNHGLHYFKIKVKVNPKISTIKDETPGKVENSDTYGNVFYRYIGVIVDNNGLDTIEFGKHDKLLRNGFYVHGRAGVFDEINYFDQDPNNQILPTKWYGTQHPFEFEFVVNNDIGAHKIFNDLVIISNNVQPSELSFEITGDVYNFNKSGIFRHKAFDENEFAKRDDSQEFKNTELVWDSIQNSYNLVVNQLTKNMNDKCYGRLRGNIQYKEDAWYTVIEPIKYTKTKKNPADINTPIKDIKTTETRIRDKFLKIRVKYTGKDLAIITALKTFMTISYA